MADDGPVGFPLLRVLVVCNDRAKRATWPPDMTVDAAARDAAVRHGLTMERPRLVSPDAVMLDPGRTLELAGVRDDSWLELFDLGGGV